MCPGNNCGWLFLDGSGRRQWCSMEVCGSRAKMRRRYERQRQARAGADTREAV
jgi:predicted RNA-binding Zn ribbon-like protein